MAYTWPFIHTDGDSLSQSWYNTDSSPLSSLSLMKNIITISALPERDLFFNKLKYWLHSKCYLLFLMKYMFYVPCFSSNSFILLYLQINTAFLVKFFILYLE